MDQQQQQNNGSWFRHLFSLDELKVSGLLIAMFAILIIDGFMALTRGDVPPQLSTITITVIAGVAGFNAISVVAGNISANRTGQMPMQNSPNMYGSNYGMNGYSGMNTMSSYGVNSVMSNGMTNQTTTTTVQPVTTTGTRAQDRPI